MRRAVDGLRAARPRFRFPNPAGAHRPEEKLGKEVRMANGRFSNRRLCSALCLGALLACTGFAVAADRAVFAENFTNTG